MEFNHKLQKLRKDKNLTQEELAELLYVSRTAVSKWESGRGYPSIDSLKAISKVFAVSIDKLLSSEEIITIAEEDKKDALSSLRAVSYGILDVMVFVFFFIPIFSQRNGAVIDSVSLLVLSQVAWYISAAYMSILGMTATYGVIELMFQTQTNELWRKYNISISLILTIIGTTVFIASQQPYMAFLLLSILIIKGFIYLKHQ